MNFNLKDFLEKYQKKLKSLYELTSNNKIKILQLKKILNPKSKIPMLLTHIDMFIILEFLYDRIG